MFTYDLHVYSFMCGQVDIDVLSHCLAVGLPMSSRPCSSLLHTWHRTTHTPFTRHTKAPSKGWPRGEEIETVPECPLKVYRSMHVYLMSCYLDVKLGPGVDVGGGHVHVDRVVPYLSAAALLHIWRATIGKRACVRGRIVTDEAVHRPRVLWARPRYQEAVSLERCVIEDWWKNNH
jgi:hypothetical protein